MGVDGAPHQHFPAASSVRRLEPFDVGQTRRIDLNDVKIPGLLPELRVGVREEVLGVGERLDRAEDVEIFGEEAVPAAADGELAVEPSRGAEVEEGVLVGGDVAVDAVDAAVDAYAAVDLVVGEADLRRRGGRGGVGVRGGERRDATGCVNGRRAGAETRRGARDASGESERVRTIAGLEMHCMTSVVASRARWADATRGRECPRRGAAEETSGRRRAF